MDDFDTNDDQDDELTEDIFNDVGREQLFNAVEQAGFDISHLTESELMKIFKPLAPDDVVILKETGQLPQIKFGASHYTNAWGVDYESYDKGYTWERIN